MIDQTGRGCRLCLACRERPWDFSAFFLRNGGTVLLRKSWYSAGIMNGTGDRAFQRDPAFRSPQEKQKKKKPGVLKERGFLHTLKQRQQPRFVSSRDQHQWPVLATSARALYPRRAPAPRARDDRQHSVPAASASALCPRPAPAPVPATNASCPQPCPTRAAAIPRRR